jgi:hypothetical protein
MDEYKQVYCSFLLRIWVEPVDGERWRFSLENTSTGKRKGFASLKNMCDYLALLTVDPENQSSEQQLSGYENPVEEEK